MKSFFKSLKGLFFPQKDFGIDREIFNGREVEYITHISYTHYSSHIRTYKFKVYFKSGLICLFQQNVPEDGASDYQDLLKVRELFINNIGFSHFQVSLGSGESDNKVNLFITSNHE